MHAELVKRYESGAITAREFCEAVWELTVQCDGYSVTVNGEFAAEFTLQRLEDLRQLDEEIHDLESLASMESWKISGWLDYGSSPSEDGMVQLTVKSYIRKMRTLARLQEKRVELTRGMKEE